MSYEVAVLPSARSDFQRLYAEDPEVLKAALSVAAELEVNPWLGKEMRSRLGLVELKDCRRVAFDNAEHEGKPRYRLVYRNEPSDGAVRLVAVLSAARRSDLEAYRRAKPRLIERVRDQGGDR